MEEIKLKTGIRSILESNLHVIPNEWACSYLEYLEKKEVKTPQTPEMVLALLSLLLPPLYNTKNYPADNSEDYYREHNSYGWIENDTVFVHFSKKYKSCMFTCFLVLFCSAVKYTYWGSGYVYKFKQK